MKIDKTSSTDPRTAIRELIEYRYLIGLFIKRDITAAYKQTVLGPLWFVLQPILSSLIYTAVFGIVAGLPTDSLPPFLFYFAGTSCWTFFSACLTRTAGTFTANAAVFGKVYFPRLTVPIATVVSQAFTFCVQFLLLLAFFGYYALRGVPLHIGWQALGVVALVLQMALLGMGCGLIVAAGTTKYRDLSIFINFGMQLWMYATPIIYAMEIVPVNLRWILNVNPMTAVVMNFKHLLFGAAFFNLTGQIASVTITLAIFALGLFVFYRAQRDFVDVI